MKEKCALTKSCSAFSLKWQDSCVLMSEINSYETYLQELIVESQYSFFFFFSGFLKTLQIFE